MALSKTSSVWTITNMIKGVQESWLTNLGQTNLLDYSNIDNKCIVQIQHSWPTDA